MADEKILDRLAKLLELADRGDENEAKVAAERAAELMARHQLDAADVIGRNAVKLPPIEKGRLDDVETADVGRMEKWHGCLGVAVAKSVGGKCYSLGRGRDAILMMVGPQHSVAAGRYIYMHLEKQVSRLSRAAGRAHGELSNAWRRAYSLAMVLRIDERLYAGREAAMKVATSTALVVVSKTELAVDAEMPADLRKKKQGKQQRPDAGVWGYRDGDRIDLGSRDATQLGEGQKALK